MGVHDNDDNMMSSKIIIKAGLLKHSIEKVKSGGPS